MSHFNENPVPDDLLHVVERLRDERPQASALELDRIKLRAMARPREARTSGKGQFIRPGLVSVMLTLGVLAGGVGAMAATDTGLSGVFAQSSTTSSASKAQYCPPKSKNPNTGPPRCGKGPKP
jgi:hypothetical protein